MKTKIIEACHQDHDGKQTGNWGKFMICQFDQEWEVPSMVFEKRSVMNACGWTRDQLLVMDLQTGEGAIFKPGGYAKGDLDKHQIWVCPLFQPFLTWLYQQDLSNWDKVPTLVMFDFETAPFEMQGHRRAGA